MKTRTKAETAALTNTRAGRLAYANIPLYQIVCEVPNDWVVYAVSHAEEDITKQYFALVKSCRTQDFMLRKYVGDGEYEVLHTTK